MFGNYSARTHYHGCPSCGRGVAYGQQCCGNPLAEMLVIEGILDGNPGEILVGEALGGGGGNLLDLVIAEDIVEAFDNNEDGGGDFF
jgi:hypothetical protein